MQLLSCSFDHKVILWDLNQEGNLPLQIFEHPDVPVNVMFNPENNKMFVSGSLDRVVRLWKIDNNLNPRQSETVQNEVTALSYSPNGKWLIVGLTTGMCTIFESKANAQLVYNTQIDCKNKQGVHACGRKVAGITFINNNEILI